MADWFVAVWKLLVFVRFLVWDVMSIVVDSRCSWNTGAFFLPEASEVIDLGSWLLEP